MTQFALANRGNLALKWIPPKTKRLLDIGCASGYFTIHTSKKAEEVYGIDPNPKFIKEAKENYPSLNLMVAKAEKLSFKDNFFNVVLLLDVLEHVDDEEKSFSEIYRILNPGGVLIITTPHKSIFSKMDADNVSINFPFLYKFMYKIAKGNFPQQRSPIFHRHYTLNQLKKLLNNKFEIQKITRRGSFPTMILRLIEIFIERRFGKNPLEKLFNFLKDVDYKINYGSLSTAICIYAIKKYD